MLFSMFWEKMTFQGAVLVFDFYLEVFYDQSTLEESFLCYNCRILGLFISLCQVYPSESVSLFCVVLKELI